MPKATKKASSGEKPTPAKSPKTAKAPVKGKAASGGARNRGAAAKRSTKKTTKGLAPREPELLAPEQTTEFVKIEKQLSVLGFFTASTNRISSKVVKIHIRTEEGERIEGEVTIKAPSGEHLPTTSDLDRYVVFLEIVNEIKRREGVVTNPVTFDTSEMNARLGIGDSGENYRETEEWLDRMSGTWIKSSVGLYHSGGSRKTWERTRGHVFNEVRQKGRQMADGSTAETNYVWLSDWQLANINNYYQISVDRNAYLGLKFDIGKALAVALQVWLYASEHRGYFAKKYEDLCEFLSITKHKYRSKILRQLQAPLDELVEVGWIREWELAESKRSDGFVIIFHHGDKYWNDRAILKSRKELSDTGSHGVLPAQAAASEPKQMSLLDSPALTPQAELAAAIAERGLEAGVAAALVRDFDTWRVMRARELLDNFDRRRAAGALTNPPGYLRDQLKRLAAEPAPAASIPTQSAQSSARPESERRRYRKAKEAARIWEEIAADVASGRAGIIGAGQRVHFIRDWLTPVAPLGVEDGELVLSVPNPTFISMLTSGAIARELDELASERGLGIRLELFTSEVSEQ